MKKIITIFIIVSYFVQSVGPSYALRPMASADRSSISAAIGLKDKYLASLEIDAELEEKRELITETLSDIIDSLFYSGSSEYNKIIDSLKDLRIVLSRNMVQTPFGMMHSQSYIPGCIRLGIFVEKHSIVHEFGHHIQYVFNITDPFYVLGNMVSAVYGNKDDKEANEFVDAYLSAGVTEAELKLQIVDRWTSGIGSESQESYDDFSDQKRSSNREAYSAGTFLGRLFYLLNGRDKRKTMKFIIDCPNEEWFKRTSFCMWTYEHNDATFFLWFLAAFTSLPLLGGWITYAIIKSAPLSTTAVGFTIAVIISVIIFTIVADFVEDKVEAKRKKILEEKIKQASEEDFGPPIEGIESVKTDKQQHISEIIAENSPAVATGENAVISLKDALTTNYVTFTTKINSGSAKTTLLEAAMVLAAERFGRNKMATYIPEALRQALYHDERLVRSKATAWVEGVIETPGKAEGLGGDLFDIRVLEPSNLSEREFDTTGYAAWANKQLVSFFGSEAPLITPEQIIICKQLTPNGIAFYRLKRFVLAERIIEQKDELEMCLMHEALHVVFPGFANQFLRETVTELLTEQIVGKTSNSRYTSRVNALKKILAADTTGRLEKAIIASYRTGDLSALRRRIIEIYGNDDMFLILMNFELFEWDDGLVEGYLASEGIFNLLRARRHLMLKINEMHLQGQGDRISFDSSMRLIKMGKRIESLIADRHNYLITEFNPREKMNLLDRVERITKNTEATRRFNGEHNAKGLGRIKPKGLIDRRNMEDAIQSAA